MDIISTFNPPRMVILGKTEDSPGRIFWIRSITQEDYAVLIAWLDDVLPGHAERTRPPSLSSTESLNALESPMGWTVLSWVALRHCGVSYDEAAELILASSDIERARLTTVLFRKRPTYKPQGIGEDIGVAWWGPGISRLFKEYHIPVSVIGDMTMDQVDMIWSDGADRENPSHLTLEQVQAMYEANKSKEPAA